MTAQPAISSASAAAAGAVEAAPDVLHRRALRSGRVVAGGSVLVAILLVCLVTLPWTLGRQSTLYYNAMNPQQDRLPPAGSVQLWFGTDFIGRSLLGRCLLGGAISLAIGVAAAAIAIVLGVSVGLLAGYRGGWTDALLMRLVDVMYGLPYILLVILFKIAFEQPLAAMMGSATAANMLVLLLAIGAVSWLTMARVVRGQVLSLRSQPFIEACRAGGVPQWRIFTRHLLPNLIGPIAVYATLTIPQAILQESFLSFLGIGIQAPIPTWGSLAAEGLLPALNPIHSRWWLLTAPCALLAMTLLSLNFLGDGLRDIFDPRREAARI
jgi:ABC-type dipeptide/oligopeptide/nickel transport system permease subunit